MGVPISQKEAKDLFDVPEVYMYVCDGKKECGKPSCTDYSRNDCCHHTEDKSHALYHVHCITAFERHPAVSGDRAAIVCVEPIRG